tara:strand:+ start:46 stop:216 length:171 start_codon:yes stop_codon:yes gene_type:complete
MDITEVLDEYCESVYGHTNWGYKSSYDGYELSSDKNYDTELNDTLVFWHDPIEKEE